MGSEMCIRDRSLTGLPILKILFDYIFVNIQKGVTRRTNIFQIEDRLTAFDYFLQLEYTVISYSSKVLLDTVELRHPLHKTLLLL